MPFGAALEVVAEAVYTSDSVLVPLRYEGTEFNLDRAEVRTQSEKQHELHALGLEEGVEVWWTGANDTIPRGMAGAALLVTAPEQVAVQFPNVAAVLPRAQLLSKQEVDEGLLALELTAGAEVGQLPPMRPTPQVIAFTSFRSYATLVRCSGLVLAHQAPSFSTCPAPATSLYSSRV